MMVLDRHQHFKLRTIESLSRRSLVPLWHRCGRTHPNVPYPNVTELNMLLKEPPECCCFFILYWKRCESEFFMCPTVELRTNAGSLPRGSALRQLTVVEKFRQSPAMLQLNGTIAIHSIDASRGFSVFLNPGGWWSCITSSLIHFKSPFPVNSPEVRDVRPSLLCSLQFVRESGPLWCHRDADPSPQVSYVNPAVCVRLSVAFNVLVVTCGRCRSVSVLAGGYKHRATCCVRCFLLGICSFAFCFFRGRWPWRFVCVQNAVSFIHLLTITQRLAFTPLCLTGARLRLHRNGKCRRKRACSCWVKVPATKIKSFIYFFCSASPNWL